MTERGRLPESPQGTEASTVALPLRVAVVLSDLPTPTERVIKYLVTQMNGRQRRLEFEFYARDQVPHCRPLSRVLMAPESDHSTVDTACVGLAAALQEDIRSEARTYGIQSNPPSCFVFVSTASLRDNYYASGTNGVTVLTLGHWQRSMSPPSLPECVSSLLLACGIEQLRGQKPMLMSHLGAKGCPFDFAARLDDARYMCLGGFICSECRSELRDAGHGAALADLESLLRRDWLGRSDEPASPAGIARKLGFDLFVAKGLAPRWSERAWAWLQEEGVRQVVVVLATIIATLLIARMGLGK